MTFEEFEAVYWFASIHKRRKLFEQLTELEGKVAELLAAIDELPVEDWVESNRGEPELIGYVMQAQGEWDRVRRAVAALRESER